MTPEQELISEIGKSLHGTVLSRLNSLSAACDLFEVYIWTLVIDAARNEDGLITYQNVYGHSVGELEFRTSPGQIYSRIHPYCHAIIQFENTPPLEVHIGIYVEGVSGVRHECDVAVMLRDEAETCRNGPVIPRHTSLRLTVECKFYVGSLGLHQGRGFMGLTMDLAQSNARFLAFNTDSDSIERMLSHHSKKWESNVTPSAVSNVNKLRTAFEKKFAEYKAKHK